MARVRERWNVLECNLGSTRFSSLARKASGLTNRTAFAGRNSHKHRLDGKKVPPREALAAPIRSAYSLGQTPVLCYAAEAMITLLGMHCQYGTASSTVKLLGQSEWIHDRRDQAGMSGNYAFVPTWPKRREANYLQFTRPLTYPRYISACLVQRSLFTSDRSQSK